MRSLGKAPVVAYLKKKGFKQTELAFQEEQQHHTKNASSNSSSSTDPDIAKHLFSFSESDNVPALYHDGYSKLRSWTYSSLDLYKSQNFFNSFREDHETMHLRDLQKLEGVLSLCHLEEMEFAHSLRQSKVNLKICQYSYELLLQYLHKTQSITMLGVINEHINFQVSPGQPSSISDDEGVTLVGSGQDAANLINQKEIHWGQLLEDSLEERLEKAASLLSDLEKVDGESKEGNLDESKKRAVEGGKQGASLKKLKKDKVVGATGKAVRIETNTVPAAPRAKSELTLPVMPTEVEHSILEDLRNRVQLSSSALPSVSFLVGIWQSLDNKLAVGSVVEQCYYQLFCRVRMILLLVSMYLGQMAGKDLTLYSEVTLGLSTQLVLVLLGIFFYPFHQIQQFSPLGHYFASASHDRTARVWSVDRIQPLRIMAGHLSDVDVNNELSCGYSDKTVRLWDVQSGECVRIFIGHRSVVLSSAMSPDGRYMASGDEVGTIMMWDLSSGRCVTPLVGHTSCSLLASGSADCTVKLWDVTASTKVLKTEENKTGSTNRLRSLKTLPTKSTPVYTLQMVKCSILVLAIVFSKESSLCCWGSFKKCIKHELHKYSDRGCSGNSIIRIRLIPSLLFSAIQLRWVLCDPDHKIWWDLF
ncbi:unnamed protein product [Camellia sinensis]